MDFQLPEYLEEDTAPQTETEMLLARVEEIESILLEGNTWRYVNGGSAAIGALVGLLGTATLSPLSILLLFSGSALGVFSYSSYVLWEGKELGIKPSPKPVSSGQKESIQDLLPRQQKAHYRLVQWYGQDAVNWIESQGCLDEVIRHSIAIKGTTAEEASAYAEQLKKAIESHYLAHYPGKSILPPAQPRRAIAPRQISQPKTPPPLESDIWDEPIAPSPLENPEDDLEDLAPEKKQHQEIEPSYQSPVAKPLKVISAKQIKQSAEGVANMYNWNDIVKAPHLLVIGSTGDGKSTLVKWLVETYCQDSSLMIIDPHTGYEDWGNLEVIGKGRDYSEVAGAFDYLQREMTDRYHLRATTKNPVFERLFVVVDEFASIAKNAPAVSRSMLSIAQEGRKVGIVLCLLAQGETVKTLGIEGEGEQRENFCRIRLGSFAQKMLMKSGQGHLASTYPRFCFVENSFAPLPNLEGFQIKNFKTVDDEPTIDPEPTPSFSPNDLLTWLEKKGDGHYKPRDISAKTKIPVAQIVEAANGLHTAGVIELKNWGELQGREIVYFKPQKASAYRDNLVAFPMGV